MNHQEYLNDDKNKNRPTRRKSTRFIARVALMAVVIMVCSLIRIPVGPVPITLQTFGVLLAGILLDPAESFFCASASRFEDYYRWMGCRDIAQFRFCSCLCCSRAAAISFDCANTGKIAPDDDSYRARLATYLLRGAFLYDGNVAALYG